MAAIYSGIHLKLKSPQTPWEDKLKLARFAWISPQCLLPNKEQVLLDWCTHALTGRYNQKVEFSQEVLEGLWCYLDDLLHSRKLHTLLKQGKTVSLRLNMAQLLLDRLQEYARSDLKPLVCMSSIMSVCQGLFSSPALASIFTTKYELMVDLQAKLCALACSQLQQASLTDAPVTESEACGDEGLTDCPQTDTGTDLERYQIKPITENRKEYDPNPKESLQTAKLFEVLLQVLSCYLSVQRQQANPNRVFTMVTNQLIQPLALLRHLLASGDFSPSHTHLRLRQQLCRDIRVKIDSILHLALFPSELLASYKDELLPKEVSGKRGPGGAKGPLKPVGPILSKLSGQGNCEPAVLYIVKTNTLTLLFKFFLESYGKSRGESEEAKRMLCFYFLTRLVQALDVGLDGHSASFGQTSPPESWSLALLAVESLLSQTLSADIYNVAADRIRHGEVQFNFYRALGQMLLNQAQPSIPAWYRCLKVLLGLNHLILEPDLDQLLSSAWVNSECMEARVLRARQLVVCSLLQTYTKLRQLPRLFYELLSVVCQPALDHLRPPLLSEGVSASLKTCLLDTPPSQSLEICSLVVDSIRRYILPDLMEAEKMEMEGEENDTGKSKKIKVEQEQVDASLKLFSLSQLIHVVLFSVKTLDSASPLPTVKRSQGLMEEMSQVIKELLTLLSTEPKPVEMVQMTQCGSNKCLASESKTWALWEQKTQEATLLLRYTLVEVDTLFHIHCSKYTPQTTTAATSETEDTIPALTQIENLLSGEIFPAHLQPSCSPMSCLLFKLLALQQMKKALLDSSLLSEPCTARLLNRVAQFILSTSEFSASVDADPTWNGQIGTVNAGSYLTARWYLVTSNLPLITPYLSADDTDSVAHVLVSSLLSRQTKEAEDSPPSCLTVSLISSQLLQSPILAELPSLFSAMVRSLTHQMISVLKAAKVPQVGPVFLKESGDKSLSTLKGNLVEDILASLKTREMSVLLTDTQSKELLDLLQILENLNVDGMNKEDMSCVFLLLFFVLTSTSSQSDVKALDSPASKDEAVLLVKLLRIMTCLLEGRNFPSVLKVVHGGTLLQATVSSLLKQSNDVRFQATCSADWLHLIKAVQGFIRCLVQIIIVRNSSVRLNLEQFTSYLTRAELTELNVAVSAQQEPGVSIFSVHLLLASLTSFSQAMTSSLGKSKLMDQTLTQMLTRTTASMGPAVESALKPQTNVQPASFLGQAFVVEVVTVMLLCELSSQSVEDDEQRDTRLSLKHMSLYQSFCQQILKEISCAHRPMDFLASSLHFLSTFYKAVRKMSGDEEDKGGKESNDLYMQILQNVHRLLTASWLSSDDVCELEPAVQELLRHLVEESTTGQFNLLLMMIREGLDSRKLSAGNKREVLCAVIIINLLCCCQLPEKCSKALWLIAPQIISAMVFLVRSSSQDVSLTHPFTVPLVMSMTLLLRQGEGLITNPHHVVLVLGALQAVPLDHLTPPVYQSTFLAVHEALFAIIQCHPQVMLNAAPSFINVFHRLLASIMQEGWQRGDGDTGPDSDVYLQCSRLVERMYSHIAATAESFTTLSAFMVAQYVTELQRVTLRPDIKYHLTEGIYLILDLCVEQDIKFVSAGLQAGVREVLSELHGSYTHYHKAQRQGEDKYTV